MLPRTDRKAARPSPSPSADGEPAAGSAPSSTGSDRIAERLRAIEIDEPEDEGAALGGGLSEPEPEGERSPEFVGRDEFFGLFKAAFNIPANVVQFRSLEIQSSEEAQARAASDAVYDICAETPLLHWVIQPGGIWMQRITAIAMFAVPKVAAVRAEFEARRIEARQAAASRPANRNAAPEPEPEAERPEGARSEPEAQPVEDDIDLTVRAAA